MQWCYRYRRTSDGGASWRGAGAKAVRGTTNETRPQRRGEGRAWSPRGRAGPGRGSPPAPRECARRPRPVASSARSPRPRGSTRRRRRVGGGTAKGGGWREEGAGGDVRTRDHERTCRRQSKGWGRAPRATRARGSDGLPEGGSPGSAGAEPARDDVREIAEVDAACTSEQRSLRRAHPSHARRSRRPEPERGRQGSPLAAHPAQGT